MRITETLPKRKSGVGENVKSLSANRIGQRIAELRGAAGLTQAALAGELGVSEVTVSRWETGEFQPTMKRIARLAKALGVEPFALLSDSENVSRETPRVAKGAHRNRAYALILHADAAAGDQPPDISRLLDEAADSGLTAEELEEVLRWASRQIRRSTAPPASRDPKYLAWLNDEANREHQRALTNESTRPLGEQRRKPREARGNIGR